MKECIIIIIFPLLIHSFVGKSCSACFVRISWRLNLAVWVIWWLKCRCLLFSMSNRDFNLVFWTPLFLVKGQIATKLSRQGIIICVGNIINFELIMYLFLPSFSRISQFYSFVCPSSKPLCRNYFFGILVLVQSRIFLFLLWGSWGWSWN